MKIIKFLGAARHILTTLGGLAVGVGIIEQSTADVISTAGDAVTTTVDAISTSGDIGIKEFAGAVAIVIGFLWSWFAPEKKLAA